MKWKWDEWNSMIKRIHLKLMVKVRWVGTSGRPRRGHERGGSKSVSESPVDNTLCANFWPPKLKSLWILSYIYIKKVKVHAFWDNFFFILSCDRKIRFNYQKKKKTKLSKIPSFKIFVWKKWVWPGRPQLSLVGNGPSYLPKAKVNEHDLGGD